MKMMMRMMMLIMIKIRLMMRVVMQTMMMTISTTVMTGYGWGLGGLRVGKFTFVHSLPCSSLLLGPPLHPLPISFLFSLWTSHL